MSIVTSSAQSGPKRVQRRALAPDLARGFMLLFIALVNAQFFITNADRIRGASDQVLILVQSTAVSGRAIPLFSLLFGYGCAWIARRVLASGGTWTRAKSVLRRRGFWMLAIGLVHAVLLLPVDIVGTYGLGLLLFVGLLRVRDAVLLWSAAGSALASTAIVFGLTAAGFATNEDEAAAEGVAAAAPSLLESNFLAASQERLFEWLLYTPITLLLVVVPPLLLGVWAGRRQILEKPHAHRRLLNRTAWVGLALAFAGGFPAALVDAELITAPSPLVRDLLWATHDLFGWFGGAGWAALITLVAMRLASGRRQQRRSSEQPSYGVVATAIAAVGERSLSCYLAQAVVFTLVFAPYGLGWGTSASATTGVAVGVLTWALTVVLAGLAHRLGRRGPAETLLRTLVYGRPQAVDHGVAARLAGATRQQTP